MSKSWSECSLFAEKSGVIPLLSMIFKDFLKIFAKKFGSIKNVRTFAIPNEKNGKNAEVAQLVEHNLAKVGVASSSLVFRSKSQQKC